MDRSRSGTLVLLRHGQSEWNRRDIFTGWVDIPLSLKGVEEALAAGELLRSESFDSVYTSMLIRAQMTAFLVMTKQDSSRIPLVEGAVSQGQGHQEWSKIYRAESRAECLPLFYAWELNERHYGELQGLPKEATRARFGKEQVKKWRRSYDIAPPKGESLEMTARRTIPYFEKQILVRVQKGESVLVVAHGNSLRSIVMDIKQLGPEELVHLEIPTGKPIKYRWSKTGGWE